MIVAAILLIGIGGSVIKPCISGTVQKVSGARATLGFAIFYMVINIGSLFGRGTAFVVRSGSSVGTILDGRRRSRARGGRHRLARPPDDEGGPEPQRTSGWRRPASRRSSSRRRGWSRGSTARTRPNARERRASSLSYIFAVAALASVVAFFVVLFTYREPAVGRGHAGEAEAVGRPHPARHGARAAERPLHALPDRDDRVLLHLQPLTLPQESVWFLHMLDDVDRYDEIVAKDREILSSV